MTYNELTRRYFEHPARIGALEGSDCYRGAAGSPSAGTWVQFDVRLAPPGAEPRVREARFLAFGCPHVIAAAALVAEQAEGGTPEPRLPQSVHTLRERLEAPVEKLGRLFVVEDAWLAALRAATGH
ncbi:MAG: iron-sulfur cluster assembly scaffold protein [Steroidobacteraceae bacterium]